MDPRFFWQRKGVRTMRIVAGHKFEQLRSVVYVESGLRRTPTPTAQKCEPNLDCRAHALLIVTRWQASCVFGTHEFLFVGAGIASYSFKDSAIVQFL